MWRPRMQVFQRARKTERSRFMDLVHHFLASLGWAVGGRSIVNA